MIPQLQARQYSFQRLLLLITGPVPYSKLHCTATIAVCMAPCRRHFASQVMFLDTHTQCCSAKLHKLAQNCKYSSKSSHSANATPQSHSSPRPQVVNDRLLLHARCCASAWKCSCDVFLAAKTKAALQRALGVVGGTRQKQLSVNLLFCWVLLITGIF